LEWWSWRPSSSWAKSPARSPTCRGGFELVGSVIRRERQVVLGEFGETPAQRAPMTSRRIVSSMKKSAKPAPSRMRSQRCDKRNRRRHSARAPLTAAQHTPTGSARDTKGARIASKRNEFAKQAYEPKSIQDLDGSDNNDLWKCDATSADRGSMVSPSKGKHRAEAEARHPALAARRGDQRRSSTLRLVVSARVRADRRRGGASEASLIRAISWGRRRRYRLPRRSTCRSRLVLWPLPSQGGAALRSRCPAAPRAARRFTGRRLR
jgi:hypothetical protein